MTAVSKSITGLRGRLTALALWLAAFSIAAALGITDSAQASKSKKYIPKDSDVVLETLPTEMSDPQLITLRNAHARNPKDLPTAISLARKYIEIGSRNSDPRQFGYAESAIELWWKLDSPPLEARLIRATLLQQRHAFDAALNDLDAIIAANPKFAQALLTRATVLTVQADYAKAEQSCKPLLLSTGLVGLTCIANVRALQHPEQAIKTLSSGLAALESSTDPETTLWSWTLLAEIAGRNNKNAQAKAAFEKALQLAPTDSYLLASYADWLLSSDDPKTVVRLLQNQTHVDGLLLRLAIAEQDLNDPISQVHANQLQDRFDATIQRGENQHQREYARYWLELKQNPELALKAALENWQVQHEALDAEILLLSAQACNRPGAAKPVTDWITLNHITDRKIASITDKLHGKL